MADKRFPLIFQVCDETEFLTVSFVYTFNLITLKHLHISIFSKAIDKLEEITNFTHYY